MGRFSRLGRLVVGALSLLCFHGALRSLAHDKALLLERCTSKNVVPQMLFWNDFQEVRDYLNIRATGRKDTEWQQHLRQFSCCGHFKKALVFYCQAGSLEAELYNKGLIKSAVGVDQDLSKLIEARKRAGEYQLPFEYVHSKDLSELDHLPGSGYDIIINNDLGFVQDIDFHLRVIHEYMMQHGGIFVTYARVRPQATSFSVRQWQRILQINDKTQESFKHENLFKEESNEQNHMIIPLLSKYFEPLWNRSLNGALAYTLLSKNLKLSKELYAHEYKLHEYVSWILREDAKYAEEQPGSQVFWFGVLKA